MREIKFRALYKDGTWRYGEYPHLAPEMSNTVSPLHIFWQTRLMELQMHTLGQYTGLKDKNGKEIFEGDIVLLDGDTPMGPMGDWHDVVEWSNDKAMFWLKHGEIPLHDETVLEVSGNVYQNVELVD